jgi:NAD-dependent SIR2 family protein deacetylase
MPIHLNYQGTTCKKCGAEFIAHKKNCPCPACGQTSDDFCDFITATIASMKDHKQLYGNYFPESWFSGSTADLVQGVIFEIFDNLEIEKPEDFTAFVLTQLETVGWEEGQEHLALQIEEIALEVFNIYRQDPDFKDNSLKDKPLNPKLKNLNPKTSAFDNFLPKD